MNNSSQKTTAIFVANRSFALTSSRLLLLRQLLRNNWQVVAAVGVDDYTHLLIKEGITVEPIVFNRGGLSLQADIQAFFQLVRLYRRYQPQLIHHFHAKPVIFGNLAALVTKQTKVVNNILGLGYAFSSQGYTRQLASRGYKLALGRSAMTIFLNSDDQELFLQNHWIAPEQAKLIISSGVDTERYHPTPSSSKDCPRILFVARLLWQKGIREFIEAAVIVRQQLPNVQFHLAGEWDDIHPDAVDRNYILQAVADGKIEFLGYLKDMEQQLRQTDIFVLPSYYREGVPRVLLEAAASGVPVVTADVPGCREAVVDGETGRIVPPQDSQALANALLDILSDPVRQEQMGRAARQRVEREFDIRVITNRYLNIYREIGLEVEI